VLRLCVPLELAGKRCTGVDPAFKNKTYDEHMSYVHTLQKVVASPLLFGTGLSALAADGKGELVLVNVRRAMCNVL